MPDATPNPIAVLPLSLKEGLPILDLQGHLALLDTGCPFSFGEPAHLDLADRRHRLSGPEGVGPFNLAAVRNIVGPEVSALVGTDFMSGHPWTLDLPAGTATIGGSEADGSACIPLGSMAFQKTPKVQIHHWGIAQQAILDTGARISYRVAGPLAGASPEGHFEDFSPFLGTIRTPLWKDTVEIGGLDLPVTYGCLPEGMARTMLGMAGADWIIGMDLLKAFRVRFDFLKGALTLTPHQSIHQVDHQG